MEKNKLIRSWVLSLLAWLGSFILALQFGAVHDASFDLVMEIRFPRATLATALGMGLAVAGASLQALFSNPLCEPYTLGISSGAALGSVLGLSLGLNWMFAGLAGPAFLGALVFAGILYLISVKSQRGGSTLLLTGVMLGFLGSSLVTLWIALSDSNGLPGVIVWLFGDLSRARMNGALFTLTGVTLLILVIWRMWQEMDALLMGEEDAISLGIDVLVTRRRIVVVNSILIALCVSAGGVIGFVGLIVPHFVRRLLGSQHRILIPFCAVWGAVILTLADSASRVLARPYDLPIGVVTSLIGAPLFLWIMLRNREH